MLTVLIIELYISHDKRLRQTCIIYYTVSTHMFHQHDPVGK